MIAALLLSFNIQVLAASPVSAASDVNPIEQLKTRVVEHRLKIGMQILILERPAAPLVSFQMMFRAGGVDETSGKTGLAHLFEHMMFKGSKTVGTKDYAKEALALAKIDAAARDIIAEESKGEKADPERLKLLRKQMSEFEAEHQKMIIPAEFDQLYQQAGGEGLNAFTGQDMTAFVVSLPSNKWELWPILESDRMANPVLREFYKERDVVMEERRMRYENSPQGKIWENFVALAYQAHPYGSPTIGWMPDLKRLTVGDAEAFFKKYYSPSNATVAIVGDVKPKEVIAKLEAHFAKVPAQPLPNEAVTEEPAQDGERRATVYFPTEPALMLGFHKPNAPHPDNIVMEVIEDLLGSGRTSRFNKNITDKKIAASIWAGNGNPGERYPNLIVISGAPRHPNGNADLEKAVWGELEKLKSEKVPEQELAKIRNRMEADFIRGLSSNGGMAGELAYAQTILGDWKTIFKILEGIRNVTPDDVQRVAKRYFDKRNVTVVHLEKETAPAKP